MIQWRRQQRDLCEGFFAGDAREWMEPWMREADQLLEDEALIESVYEAQARRHPESRRRGRPQTPAEVTLRLALLKHIRNWTFEETEREVRANLVYREFTRIGGGKVPDAKTMARLVQALGPGVVEQMHQRVVGVAREKKVVQGRKMRVDTTVVETNIHYPTDSSLMGDGMRVLTRVMKKITAVVGEAGTRLRDRMRTARRRVLEVALASRSKGEQREEKLKEGYRRVLRVTRQVVHQARPLFGRNPQGGETSQNPEPAEGGALAGAATGADDGVGSPGDPASAGARLRRRDTRGREVGQSVRADHRSDPQRQGQQADRVWEDGEDSGSGKPDHHRLSSVCPAAQ